MKGLTSLIKLDFALLRRNNILTVSLIVTLLYIAVFRWLGNYGSMEHALVLIIFNDPALLGFLFAGVMVLFEKNERTIYALAATPMNVNHYVLSKSLLLTLLSLVCCTAMVLGGYGADVHPVHFICGCLLSTLLFAFIGFILVARQTTFNGYMFRSVGVLLVLALPFLGYFGITGHWWWCIVPSLPSIDLFDAAFHPDDVSREVLLYAYTGSIFWCVLTWRMAVRAIAKGMLH